MCAMHTLLPRKSFLLLLLLLLLLPLGSAVCSSVSKATFSSGINVRLIPELLITFSERLWQQSCDEGKVIRDVSLMVKSSRDSTVLGGRRTQDGCQRWCRCVSDGGLALFCLIIREQMFSDFFYARKLKLLLCFPFIEEKWGSLRKHWCPEELLCHEDWWENVNDFSIADVLLGSCRLIAVNVEHPPPPSASHGCSPPFFEFADWTIAGWDGGHTPVMAKHAPGSDALDWEPLRAGSVGYLSKSSNA